MESGERPKREDENEFHYFTFYPSGEAGTIWRTEIPVHPLIMADSNIQYYHARFTWNLLSAGGIK